MMKYEAIRDMELEYHQTYHNSILLVLSGNFYNAYGKDAYILCYILGYKPINKLYRTIEDEEVSVPKTGFPRDSLGKVLLSLEDKKISYVIKVKDKSDIFKDFKNLNTYERRYEVSKRYCMDKIKMSKIIDKCNQLCGKRDFSDVLDKIQDYIEEYEE